MSDEPTEPSAAPGRNQFLAAVTLSAGMLGASTAGLIAIAEALEERETVAAATDLRLAADRVALGGLAREAPEAVDTAERQLLAALATLRDRSPTALHGLSPETIDEVDRLIDTLITHGEAHLAGEVAPGVPAELALLDEILAVLSAEASADSEQAERGAQVAVGVAAAMALLSGFFLVRARNQEIGLRQSLAEQAQTDDLTRLPNRRLLDRYLADAGQAMTESGGLAGLMIVDLDGFKNVNDRFGHHVGDRVLIECAERLVAACSPQCRPLRLGADEFAVLMIGLGSADEAEATARRFQEAIDQPFDINGELERLGVSVGVTSTGDPESVDELSTNAALALHRAKRVGGNEVVVFEPSLADGLDSVSRITQALRSADHDREFRLLYQPIFTVDGQTVVGYEALLRWDSPTLGPVRPDQFIPVAEHCGEIGVIGRWVRDQVGRQIHCWDEAGLATGVPVSVNASPIELASPGFVSEVVAMLDRWRLPRERLVVEVTESAVLEDDVAVERLAELRRLGVLIAIDDFGSGYSNIGQILRVPFDVLKIDRSLLTALTDMRIQSGGDPSAPCAVIQSVVSIASVFGANVVCEGVETEQQRQSLAGSGIDRVQGFLLGRPAPPLGHGDTPAEGGAGENPAGVEPAGTASDGSLRLPPPVSEPAPGATGKRRPRTTH